MTVPNYLPSMTTPLPDEAHEALRRSFRAADRRILDQTVQMDDLSMLTSALADLAATLGAAVPAAEATHAVLQQADADETAARKQADSALNTRVDATNINVATALANVDAQQRLLTTQISNLAAEVSRATQAESALRTDLMAAVSRVAVLEARALRGTTGQVTVSSVLGAGTQTAAVKFAADMPDTNYTALISVDTNATLQVGSITPVYPVTNKTRSGCTVTLRNTGISVVSNIVVQVAALSLS